jgi:hypothetical protein
VKEPGLPAKGGTVFMAIRRPKKKMVSDMFFNDPERGQQIIDRIHRAKADRGHRPKRRRSGLQEIQIIPDEGVF